MFCVRRDGAGGREILSRNSHDIRRGGGRKEEEEEEDGRLWSYGPPPPPLSHKRQATSSTFLLPPPVWYSPTIFFFPSQMYNGNKTVQIGESSSLACLCLPASLSIPAPPRLVTQETNSVFFFFAGGGGGGGGGGVINGSCYSFPPSLRKCPIYNEKGDTFSQTTIT